MAFYSAWIKIASREASLYYMRTLSVRGLISRIGRKHNYVLQLLPDQRPAECGLAGRVGRMCVCCGSSLTGDLPSAVWPAGLVPHVFVCCGSSLTGDLPSVVWLAGLVSHVFVCCGSSLTDRCECFVNLMLILLALPVVSRHRPFIFGIKPKIGKEMKT